VFFLLICQIYSDDEGNDDNLKVLKIMRKVGQKIKFRTTN